MDFRFSEDQETIRELARQILADQTSPERAKELEDNGEWYDRKLWTALAEANLTALCLPEAIGGGGCGFFELALVLEETGRTLAPVPLLPTLALAGLPIARFGTAEQQERWLAPVASAEAILTAALHETGSQEPERPRVAARRDGREVVPGHRFVIDREAGGQASDHGGDLRTLRVESLAQVR